MTRIPTATTILFTFPTTSPRPIPRCRPADRAAQFSPFAALTGHEAAIRETARLTDERAELDENAKAVLVKNSMFRKAARSPGNHRHLFSIGRKKIRGAYVSVTGRVKKLDLYGQCLLMEDGLRIPLGELYDMDGRIFGIK